MAHPPRIPGFGISILEPDSQCILIRILNHTGIELYVVYLNQYQKEIGNDEKWSWTNTPSSYGCLCEASSAEAHPQIRTCPVPEKC